LLSVIVTGLVLAVVGMHAVAAHRRRGCAPARDTDHTDATITNFNYANEFDCWDGDTSPETCG
jgi:hypothetical protein